MKLRHPLTSPKPPAQWPHPVIEIKVEPHFLFIITPPYSGSTALAQILNSCKTSGFLQDQAEGQWLIPGMCTKDRWQREKYIDWESVRAVWLKKIRNIQQSHKDIEIIIEKSPPNLVRVDHLINTFPNASLLAFNRNPYANCSSILHRIHKPKEHTQNTRVDLLKSKAAKWLDRSRWIRKWIFDLDVIHFTYEDLCSDPGQCISLLKETTHSFDKVDIGATIRVKDYKEQKLSNQNDRQIANLTHREIDAISEVLSTDTELLSFFGYSLM